MTPPDLAVLCLAAALCGSTATPAGRDFPRLEQLVVTVTAGDSPGNSTRPSPPPGTTAASGPDGMATRISAADMMDSLKLACKNLRDFSMDSKYAQDLVKSSSTSEMLSREFKQLDSEDKCGFGSYSAALRIFLKTCSVIDDCPLPKASPSYQFTMPTSGPPKSGQVLQSYVAVPSSLAPKPNNGLQAGMVPRPVLNLTQLSSAVPSWIPVVQLMQMQQAAALASQLQRRTRLRNPAALRRVAPESDAVDK